MSTRGECPWESARLFDLELQLIGQGQIVDRARAAFNLPDTRYMVVLNPEMFATDGEVITGTTNVDFTAWLWAALNELRSSRETWLRWLTLRCSILRKLRSWRHRAGINLCEVQAPPNLPLL